VTPTVPDVSTVPTAFALLSFALLLVATGQLQRRDPLI
jgi:hypothetical protein